MATPSNGTRTWRRALPLCDFWSDADGQALREYVLAVVAATLIVIVVFTLLAQRVYVMFLDLFGSM